MEAAIVYWGNMGIMEKKVETTTLFRVKSRPLISKPPPLNREHNRDPNIKALKRRGFINHGSTLGCIFLILRIRCRVVGLGFSGGGWRWPLPKRRWI